MATPKPIAHITEKQAHKFWDRVLYSSEGCWTWTGTINEKGYGKVCIRGLTGLAHRIAYTLDIGPIPEGLTLDHLCRNKACVRPSHLEAVTAAENTKRGVTKATCVRGHDMSVTRVRGRCRLCVNARKWSRINGVDGEAVHYGAPGERSRCRLSASATVNSEDKTKVTCLSCIGFLVHHRGTYLREALGTPDSELPRIAGQP